MLQCQVPIRTFDSTCKTIISTLQRAELAREGQGYQLTQVGERQQKRTLRHCSLREDPSGKGTLNPGPPLIDVQKADHSKEAWQYAGPLMRFFKTRKNQTGPRGLSASLPRETAAEAVSALPKPLRAHPKPQGRIGKPACLRLVGCRQLTKLAYAKLIQGNKALLKPRKAACPKNSSPVLQ